MTNKRTTKKAPAEAGAGDVLRATDRLAAIFRQLENTPHKELEAKLRREESELTAPRATDRLRANISATDRIFKRDRKKLAGSSKGGKNKPVPKWHDKAVEHAKVLSTSGRESHELTSLCARRLGKSDDAVRKVLQDAGLVRSRKTRVK